MSGYIGSRASVVSSGAEQKKVFNISSATTSLTGCSYTPNLVHVYHNGVRLVDGTDYTATDGTTITLTTAAQSGDEVVVISYGTFQVANAYTKAEADGRYLLNTADTGKLLQVVQVVFDGTFSTTVSNGTFAQVTGLNASITPSSTSSKILVIAHVNATSYYWELQSRLSRDGTAISGALGATRGSRTRVTTSTNSYDAATSGYGDKNFDFSYLDSPATTSSVTYGVQVSGYNGNTVGINYNAYSDNDSADYFGTPISTITLMEIAG